MMAAGGGHSPRGQGRIEPVLHGAVPTPDPLAGRASPPSIPAWRDRRWWRRGLLGLAVFAVLLGLFRQPLAERIWPDTRIERLLRAADAALAAGQLSADDGSGARQLYEAAQALDGDRGEASAGLAKVAGMALEQANSALDDGRLDAARNALRLGRELQAPRTASEAVAERLRQREMADVGLDALLEQARQARTDGHLEGDADAALPLYARILRLQPGNLEALEGREDALADLLQDARRTLARGDLALAAAQVAAAQRHDPGHFDLPESLAQVSAAIDGRRRQAEAALRRGNLAAASEAWRSLRQAALASADAAQLQAAEQGLERVALAHVRRSRTLAADLRFAAAERALQQAREIAPRQAEVVAAEQYLQRVRTTRSQVTAMPPSPQRERQVQALLLRMQAASDSGNWLLPPGESAFDQLRAAQSLAPDDPKVEEALRRLRQAVQKAFERELGRNRPVGAQECLDAWIALEPGNPRLPVARRQLAAKWLAVGSERFSLGDMAYAAQALERARLLDPDVAGLEVFARRLHDARVVRPDPVQ